MLWAVRAVPVLVIFGALGLLQRNPPVPFLVLTLVRLALGVLTLVAIHKRRRDALALAYVVVVFVTSLVDPVRGRELLILSALALVVIAGDQLWQRSRPVPPESADVVPVSGENDESEAGSRS
jgi:hypothetical protein